MNRNKSIDKELQLDEMEVKVIGVLKDVPIQLSIDLRIQDTIKIHVVDIPKIYKILLSRGWTKFLRGWFSTDFTQLWLPWKELNNQTKMNAKPKLKTMIIDYNGPNEVLFNKTDLGSYQVMTFEFGET